MNIYIKKYLIEFKCVHKGYNKTSPCNARTCIIVVESICVDFVSSRKIENPVRNPCVGTAFSPRLYPLKQPLTPRNCELRTESNVKLRTFQPV